MSHEIEITDKGAAMFYQGEKPWHGLGTEVPHNVDSQTAMELAQLAWTVGLKPVFAKVNIGTKEAPNFIEVPIETQRAVIRETDKAFLGVVGEGYAPIQNLRAFQFMDAVIGDKAWYHTAGSLKGGRVIWMLCEIPGDIVVNGNDVSKKYILLSTSHDGTRALQAQFTSVRVVCNNTLTMALKDAKNVVTVRHTKNHEVRMEEAIRILSLANKWFEAFQADATFLSQAEFTENKMKVLSEYMFPSDETDPEKIPTQTLNGREILVKLFSKGKGNKGKSAWDALNACTEFADWHRTSRAPKGSSDTDRRSNKLDSVWFGSAATFKEKAFNAVKQLANGVTLLLKGKDDDSE